MNEVKSKLVEEFADKEYAHSYMAAHNVSRIAGQVYWSRKMRNWTQSELAERAGMAQERISKIEAGDFTSLTMSTLQKLAMALDINLRVEFEPFSHAIVHVCNQSISNFQLADREESLNEIRNSLAAMPGPSGLPPIFINNVFTSGITNSSTATATTIAPPPSVRMMPIHASWQGKIEA